MIPPSNPKPTVSNAKPPSVEPRNNLELVLPTSLQGVTQPHMNLIRCDDLDTSNTAKELMQQQWSELVKPGCRVKVTITDKFVDAVVERTRFISKLSFDCCYTFATSKAEVKWLDRTQLGCFSSVIYRFNSVSLIQCIYCTYLLVCVIYIIIIIIIIIVVGSLVTRLPLIFTLCCTHSNLVFHLGNMIKGEIIT